MADNGILPSEINLDKLFYKESLFDSVDKLREGGFQIVRGSSKGRVSVAGHQSVPGYLFKKFLRDVSHSYEKQLGSYERRIRGARDLKTHLEALDIHSIVVPRKWLCELPSRFSSGGKPEYVVVVEKCDFLDHDKSKQCYRAIAKDTLKDLCTIFFTFKHIDFSSRNMPFTTEGKIAFIDTGYLTRIAEDLTFRRKNYKKNVDKLFTDESRRFAKSLWDEFARRHDLLEGPGIGRSRT